MATLVEHQVHGKSNQQRKHVHYKNLFSDSFVKNPNKFECLDINRTRGVSHCGLAIYIKKYLKAEEEELWKLKYFTMQNYNLQKNPLKKIKSFKVL
jgi:hypothetical protein